MTDKELLELLKKDPDLGIEQLLKQYINLIYTIVKSKLSASYHLSSDIEDCVADVFSSFYTHLSDYDPSKSSIKSYLCIIARNQAINLSKKRSLVENRSLDDEYFSSRFADDFTIESELEEAELRREVIAEVKALGKPCSDIIFRKFYYGQSSAEIAEALGLSVSNVNTQTHRALNKLRKKFGDNKI